MDKFLEKLLDGEKVEWKPLGELADIIRGNGLPKSDFTQAGVPAIHYGQIYTYYGSSTVDTISFVSQETAKSLKKVEYGDIIITNTSENVEDVGKALVYLGKEQAVTGGHASIIKPKASILSKYIVYFTQSQTFSKLKQKYVKGTKVIDLSANDLAKIIIPIPPLHVQERIVEILDAFTELNAELNAELTAREKQYAYYRDKLLSPSDFEARGIKYEWKTLGEICGLVTTGNLNANSMENNGKYPFFTCNEKPYKINIYAFDIEAILISGNGSQVGHINYYKGKFNAYQRTYILGHFNNENIIVMYLFHYLKYMLKAYIYKNSRKGSVPYITMPMLNAFTIPIPPIEEQERIVKILDKFNTLANSISEGLPREIELRQKQYEYYREQLLSFK